MACPVRVGLEQSCLWKDETHHYCDFKQDGVVSELDYALLWMNFGQTGQ